MPGFSMMAGMMRSLCPLVTRRRFVSAPRHDARRRHRKNRSNLNQIVIALTMTVNFVSKSGRAISFKLYGGFAAENRRQFYLVVPAFI
jgi:hypothetical protein